MPTYSKDTLITALTAYCNSEYLSIRKCAYAFNILVTTLSKQLSTQTSRSKLYKSWQIFSTAEEKALLKVITRLTKSSCPITLPLIRDLTKEIQLSHFCLGSTPTFYTPISK
jgi:hypothetical protein